MTDTTLRLDKFLWHSRLAKTRTAAQQIAETGYVRLNGRRIERAHAAVRIGDVLSLPLQRGVTIVRVEALPPRRVGAKEIPAVYTLLDTKS